MSNHSFEVEYRDGEFHFFIDGCMSSSEDPDDCKRKIEEWAENVL